MYNYEEYKRLVSSYNRLVEWANYPIRDLSHIRILNISYEGLMKNAKNFDNKLLRDANLTKEELVVWDDIIRRLSIKPNMMQRSRHLQRTPTNK